MMVDGEQAAKQAMTLESARSGANNRTLESARGAQSLDGSMNESIKYKNTDGDMYEMGDGANGEDDDGSNSEEGKQDYSKYRLMESN